MLCLSPILSAFAGQLPLTVKEISLMLRSGYSSNAVLKELAVRHFADSLDEAKANSLVQAHASEDLMKALQSGLYSLSASETALAQQQIADQATRREVEGARLGAMAQNPFGQPNQPGGLSHHAIYDSIKDDLVSWQNGSLTHFGDAKLENKKYIALYFSAHWCGPCRKFTPELVDYYNRVAPQHPEFDVIFVSNDRSPADMETYMKDANMPWPAIEFQKVRGKGTINKYADRGIPCLVLIDTSGKVVSNSYDGAQYVGPKKVLADLDGIFARGSVAQAR